MKYLLVAETANHFRCIDMIIDDAKAALTEKFIKELHLVLKNGTSDSRKDWFAVGDYKKLPNEVGGRDTALPEKVADKMKALLTEYSTKEEKTLEDILDFHVKFERIHPFQDGNGRVGRLIMFKECLKYNIVPFIIEDNLKMFYYRGLKEWEKVTAIDGQDAIVETYTGGANRRVVHPCYQAWSYAALIRDYNEYVQDNEIGLHPCAYLHNYPRIENDPLDKEQYQNIMKETPAFTYGQSLVL